MYKLLIFGTGSKCEELLKEHEEHFKQYDIIGFLDNNEKKQGGYFNGKLIYSPSEINLLKYDYIYIASSFVKEITTQLVVQCKVKEECILPWWYFGIKNNLLINEKNINHTLKDNEDLKKCKMVIYTAIFGSYDNLNDPEYIEDNCDYVCFTDDENLKSDIWDIRIIKDMDINHTRKMAEQYSILAHKYFSEYKISVYVDGNVLIKGSFREYSLKYMKHHNMLAFPHPWRYCAYDEAIFSKKCDNYKEDNLYDMIARYEKEGLPKNMGLISAGIMVRRHNESDVIKTMECWWDEVKANSSNDQVSYTYAAWKQSFCYDMSPLWIYDNEYVTILKHKRDLVDD